MRTTWWQRLCKLKLRFATMRKSYSYLRESFTDSPSIWRLTLKFHLYNSAMERSRIFSEGRSNLSLPSSVLEGICIFRITKSLSWFLEVTDFKVTKLVITKMRKQQNIQSSKPIWQVFLLSGSISLTLLDTFSKLLCTTGLVTGFQKQNELHIYF